MLPGISGARALGTIAAVEIGTRADGYMAQIAPALLGFFRERNLLLRPLGNTVYAMPPYCINDADLKSIHDAVGEAAARFGMAG